MNTKMDLINFSFHDCGLVGATHQGSTIVLAIDYFDEDDSEFSVSAVISGVESISCGDRSIERFSMERSEGQIHRLVKEGGEITLIVFWDDYSPLSRIMRIYKFSGESIDLQAVR